MLRFPPSLPLRLWPDRTFTDWVRRAGNLVALRGVPRIVQQVHVDSLGDVIWHRHHLQQGVGNKHRWLNTVHDTQQFSKCTLELQGRPVSIVSAPTEVHSVNSRRTRFGGDHWLLSHFRPKGGRDTHWWIPAGVEITIVGRLESCGSGWWLVPDGRVGLFLSVHSPARAALWESIKGILGMVGVAAYVTYALLM